MYHLCIQTVLYPLGDSRMRLSLRLVGYALTGSWAVVLGNLSTYYLNIFEVPRSTLMRLL